MGRAWVQLLNSVKKISVKVAFDESSEEKDGASQAGGTSIMSLR